MHRIAHETPCGELGRQASVARQLGSAFVGAVLDAGERQLSCAPRTAALIAGWPGDPSAAALAMRFNAALHALARREAYPALSALYRGEHQDFDGAIGSAMAAEDGFIATWMLDTPQTNEVGRAAAISAALMHVWRDVGMPFDLLEMGSSCGLNLNLARYAYDLGGVMAGDLDSHVRIAPEWRGSPLQYAPINILSARGVDLNPLNAANVLTRERLLAYIWPDQPERAARLQCALALAQQHPPQLDRGNATDWLNDRLEEPQVAGTCRVLFHSMFLQYVRSDEREAILRTIHEAGTRATLQRPLVWISLEWTEGRREVQLRSTCWPNGHTRLLATCHAYGNWVDWHG